MTGPMTALRSLGADQAIALACLAVSAISLGVVLRVWRSFGCYTARIERSNEGTRRSQELTRQSNERLAGRLDEMRADNDYTREANRATLTALLDEYRRLRAEQSHPQRSA